MHHLTLRHCPPQSVQRDIVLQRSSSVPSRRSPDLFATVPCHKLGATVEAVHTQGWHTMHGRALCEIYKLKKELPAICGKETVKSIRIFNSGVMLLSEAHRPLFDRWRPRPLDPTQSPPRP